MERYPTVQRLTPPHGIASHQTPSSPHTPAVRPPLTCSFIPCVLCLCVRYVWPDTDFQQQRLRAWQPALTPRWVVSMFVLLGVLFIPIGAALVYASTTVYEDSVRYDTLCGAPTRPAASNCTVSLTVSHDMSPPIFVYYQLHNFNQNHRRYATSQSVYQLHGDNSPDLSGCSPERWQHTYSQQGNRQDIYPCGAIAGSFFNDTFTATLVPSASSSSPVLLGGPSTNPDSRQWEKSHIAYSGDLDTKYQLNPTTLAAIAAQTYNGTDNESPFSRVGPLRFTLPLPNDPDFAVWQRVAALPTFKKLYRVIRCVPTAASPTCSGSSGKLYAGDVLQVQVANNFDISPFSGQKAVVISTVSWLGGRNFFLGAAWITVGGLCFLLALLFGLVTLLNPPRLDQRVFSVPAGGQLVLNQPAANSEGTQW